MTNRRAGRAWKPASYNEEKEEEEEEEKDRQHAGHGSHLPACSRISEPRRGGGGGKREEEEEERDTQVLSVLQPRTS